MYIYICIYIYIYTYIHKHTVVGRDFLEGLTRCVTPRRARGVACEVGLLLIRDVHQIYVAFVWICNREA